MKEIFEIKWDRSVREDVQTIACNEACLDKFALFWYGILEEIHAFVGQMVNHNAHRRIHCISIAYLTKCSCGRAEAGLISASMSSRHLLQPEHRLRATSSQEHLIL